MRSCRNWWRRSAACRSEARSAARPAAGSQPAPAPAAAPARARGMARAGGLGIALAAARAAARLRGLLSGSMPLRAHAQGGRTLSAGDAPGCLQWRPSPLLAAGLVLIGLLGGAAAIASELPGWLSWPLAASAAGRGIALARRELRRPPRRLRLAGARLWLDQAPVAQVRLHWRGPLLRMDLRHADGRRERLLWWPDRLDAHARRELRLAAAVAIGAPEPRSMAP